MGRLFWLVLLIIFSTGHLTSGQNVGISQLLPECNTACPSNKRCVQDNATVVWELFSSNECKNYLACYGSNSDYPDDTTTNNIFAGRFYPIVIALGSSVYFEAKYSNPILRPFTIYNVSQAMFLACKNATQTVGILTSTVKVPDRFVSSVGYKYFIAKGRNSFLPCDFGLRLHVNVMDVTNCSGTPSGNLCSGKGRCITESFTGDMHCECCSGYTGQFCEELNACSADPCKRGNCSDIIAGHSEAFNCTCEAGYTGQQCDIDIKECDLPENQDACKNGALCVDAVNAYDCLCLSGFHGKHCEFVSNLCDLIKPCKNNAICSRVGPLRESYVCHCPPGFYGRNCTLNTTTSSVVVQLSSFSKTSQLASSLVSSIPYSYSSTQNYDNTASSYFTSVFQSTVNSASLFYSSMNTNPTTEATADLLTSTLAKSSLTIHRSSNKPISSQSSLTWSQSDLPQGTSIVSNSLSLVIVASSSLSQISHIISLISPSTVNLGDSTSATGTTDTTVSPSARSSGYSLATDSHQTSSIGLSSTPSTIATPLVSPSSKTSVTMATSMVTNSANTPTPTLPSVTQRNTHSSQQIPYSFISPSVTMVTPSSTVVPTQVPLQNQTCADNPCGDYGVCTDRNSLASGLSFNCDCRYPTVGPLCTADIDLHFPHFNGKSYIEYKPITFGSSVNKFVISFHTRVDGTILFSAHRTYRDFIKLEVIGGLLRFSVDAGDRVVSVTSRENVANENTTSASFGYDTQTGTVFMSVNNGVEQRVTTRGQLKDVQLYHPLYLGGIIPLVYTHNKPDVGVITPFVGCIRELEFNERAIELSDAVDWANVSECDLPACRARPCKNAGFCVQNNEDVSDYICLCSYPYSGKNCDEKYACAVNICNGGVCLNTSVSGVQCLCPFGRGGISCNQDIEVTIPTFNVVMNHSSYLQYLTPRGAVNQLDIRMEIKLMNTTRSRGDGLLFYVGLHDHLSVGSAGDYLALGMVNNSMVLQFNLGSGAVNITSDLLSSDQEWFTILAGRKGRDGYLYVDSQLKEARSPPPLEGLNVFGHLYIGGVPDFSMLNSEVIFTEGFRGSIKDPKLRTGASNAWISLGTEHSTNTTNFAPVIRGFNIQDQKVNACVVGACLNNGSCESFGASYVCRCPSEWSGRTCNDTSVPCRGYNPCHGRSTCRMRDSGFRCDCPPGKAGRYCENDLNITTPSFGEYSYLSFLLAKIKIHTQTSITVAFSTPAVNGILFYVTRDITSLSGDFLSITLHDRHVYLIYNLGTGIAKCRSPNEILVNQNNNITVTRDGRRSNLELNGDEVTCTSRGGATQLNGASVFYLGGVPDLSQVQPMAYENARDLRDFTGCVEQLTINGHSFDLTQRGVLDGRNIVNCDTNQIQA